MALSTDCRDGKVTFVDLPLETQNKIFSHVDGRDLHALLLVSKHCFDLASAEIYRDLNFSYTTSDTPNHGATISRLPDALQSIVASEHDYAHYIKSFRYGIADGSSHNSLLMGRILWDSSADPSKVLNTTILLMVKQATILERFQWDIPIELNGAIYKALHRIQSLRHLRLRLDVQASVTASAHQAPLPLSHPSNNLAPPTHATPPSPFPVHVYQGNHSKVKALNPSIESPVQYNYWNGGRAFSKFKQLVSLTLLGISDLGCLSEIAGCLKSSSATLKNLTLSISQDLALKSRKPPVPIPMDDELTETDLDDDDDIMDPSQPHGITTKKGFNEADIRREKIAQESTLARIFDLQDVALEGKRLEKSLALTTKSDALEAQGIFTLDAKAMAKELIGCYKTLRGTDINEHPKEFLEMTVKAAERYLKTLRKKTKKPIKEANKSFSLIPESATKASGSVPPPPQPVFDIATTKIPSSDSSSFLPLSSSQWHFSEKLPLTSSMKSSSGKSGTEMAFTHVGNPYVGSHTPPYQPGPSELFQMPHLNSSLYPPISGASGDSFALSSASKSAHHSFGNESTLSSMLSDLASFPHTNVQPGISSLMNETAAGDIPEGQDNIDPFFAVDDVDPNEGSENAEGTSSSNIPVLFSASEPIVETRDGSIDIDMEHPDEDTLEAGADQETSVDSEEAPVSPRKRARFDNLEPTNPGPTRLQAGAARTSLGPEEEDQSHSASKSPDEAMQDYIRETHGLSIEEFCLYMIPLKGSILARGLDLNVLRRLTLLNVGSQTGFWLLLTRLQHRSIQVCLQSIHTDDVSIAFLEFLETFKGLTELFMHERSTKREIDTAIIARASVNVTDIRKKGLRKHIQTLKRLMIKNDNDDAWDLDARLILLLSREGGCLRELAVSMSLDIFHIFMQNVSSFLNLIALHLLVLREHNRAVLYPESLHSAVDSFSHYPEANLRWIAFNNDVRRVSRKSQHWSAFFKTREEGRKMKAQTKSKGKGKAKATDDDDTGESSDADLLGDEISQMGSAMRLHADTSYGLGEVEDVKIFRKGILLGKL